MRQHIGAERVIERLDVDRQHLHAACDQPVGRFLVDAGRVGVVVLVVAEIAMRARVDHHDVARLDLGCGRFQIGGRDHAPFPLRDRHRHPGTEEAPKLVTGDARRVF